MERVEILPVVLSSKYAEKWNVTSTDFVGLFLNGKRINDTLYRIGGLNSYFDGPYFKLLKYVESEYSDSITKDPKKKKHLVGLSCVLDQQGNEILVADQFDHFYIIKDSCVAVKNVTYYNLNKGGEVYTDSSKMIESKEYIVIKNDFKFIESKHKKPLGMFMINKITGEYTLYPV